MTTIEKIAFLKGLYEGATQDLSINESKLFKALIGIANELAITIAELKGNVSEMNGKIDEIDEDLSYLEEEFFNREEDEGDPLFDSEDYDLFEKSMEDYFDNDLKVVEFPMQEGSVTTANEEPEVKESEMKQPEMKQPEIPIDSDTELQEEVETYEHSEADLLDYYDEEYEEFDESIVIIDEQELPEIPTTDVEIVELETQEYPEFVELMDDDMSEQFPEETFIYSSDDMPVAETSTPDESAGLSVIVSEEFDDIESDTFEIEDEEEIFIESCPNCDGELRLTYEVLQDGSCICPNCHETLYFEILDDE